METQAKRQRVPEGAEETTSVSSLTEDAAVSNLAGDDEHRRDAHLDLLRLQPGNYPIEHVLQRLRPNNSIRQDGERHNMHVLHRRLHRREPHRDGGHHHVEETTETLPLVAQVTVDGQGSTLGSGTVTAPPSASSVPPSSSSPAPTVLTVTTSSEVPEVSTAQSSAPAPESSPNADSSISQEPSSTMATPSQAAVSSAPPSSAQTQTEPPPASPSVPAPPTNSDASTPSSPTSAIPSSEPPADTSSGPDEPNSTSPTPTSIIISTTDIATLVQSTEPSAESTLSEVTEPSPESTLSEIIDASSTEPPPRESSLSVITSTDPSVSTTLAAITTSTTADPLSTSTSSAAATSIASASTVTGGSGVGPGAGGVGPATGEGTGVSSNRGGNDGNSSSTNSGPTTPVLVGGIVGGVAGLAFLLAVILLFLRWRRRKRHAPEPVSGTELQPQLPPLDVNPAAPEPGATELSPPPPIAAPGFFQRLRPDSQPTAVSSEPAPSERGFYRVAGRKIAPAIGTGSDGYQGQTLSEAEFGRDDGGPYAGPSTSQSVVVAGPSGTSRDGGATSEGERVVIRPGAQRTPVTSPGPFSQVPSPRFDSPPRRPAPGVDGVGRSHPSRDGSRGSRFTEDVH